MKEYIIHLDKPEQALLMPIFRKALDPASGFNHELDLSDYKITVETNDWIKASALSIRADDGSDRGAYALWGERWFEAVDIVKIPDGVAVIEGGDYLNCAEMSFIVWEPI